MRGGEGREGTNGSTMYVLNNHCLQCYSTWNCLSLSFKASMVGGKLSSPTSSWKALSWLVSHSENSRNSSSYCFFFVLGDFFSPLGGVFNSRTGEDDLLLGGVSLVSLTSGFLTSLGVEARTGFSFSGTTDSTTTCLGGVFISDTKTPRAFSFRSRFRRIVRMRPQRLFNSARRAFLWGLAPLEDSLFKKSWRHSWITEWHCKNCMENKNCQWFNLGAKKIFTKHWHWQDSVNCLFHLFMSWNDSRR